MGRCSGRICVVCGTRERHKGERYLFFGNFPMEQNRCKEWVRVVGNEELVHLPIEKLHQIRFVCGNHFSKRDFNKKGNRLKKRAIPTLNLTATPLSEDQMIEFPQHMASSSQSAHNPTIQPSIGSKPSSNERVAVPISVATTSQQTQNVPVQPQQGDELADSPNADDDDPGFSNSPNRKQVSNDNIDSELGFENLNASSKDKKNSSFHNKSDSEVPKSDVLRTYYKNFCDETEREDVLPSKVDDEVLSVCDDDDDVLLVIGEDDHLGVAAPIDTDPSGGDEEDGVYIPQEHQGFRCNVCLGNIVGFRYRCCECDDYDMCGGCEARGEHPHHYVLRVPGGRNLSDVRRVLASVHHALAHHHQVKDEPVIKIEHDPDEERPPDPLDTGDASEDQHADHQQADTEDEVTPRDPPGSPPAKKRRKEPTRHDRIQYKFIGSKDTFPAALDALKRRATVRLEAMPLPRRENVSQTPSRSASQSVTRSVDQIKENTLQVTAPVARLSEQVGRASAQNVPLQDAVTSQVVTGISRLPQVGEIVSVMPRDGASKKVTILQRDGKVIMRPKVGVSKNVVMRTRDGASKKFILHPTDIKVIMHPEDSANKKVIMHPTDLAGKKVIMHPGDGASKKVTLHPTDMAGKKVIMHPEDGASKKFIMHPTDLAGKKVIMHPGDGASKKVTLHPTDMAGKKVIMHPEDGASKKFIMHPTDLASKKVIMNPADRASKKVIMHSTDLAGKKIIMHPGDGASKKVIMHPTDIAAKMDIMPGVGASKNVIMHPTDLAGKKVIMHPEDGASKEVIMHPTESDMAAKKVVMHSGDGASKNVIMHLTDLAGKKVIMNPGDRASKKVIMNPTYIAGKKVVMRPGDNSSKKVVILPTDGASQSIDRDNMVLFTSGEKCLKLYPPQKCKK